LSGVALGHEGGGDPPRKRKVSMRGGKNERRQADSPVLRFKNGGLYFSHGA